MFLSYATRRLQWIAIDCKRNLLWRTKWIDLVKNDNHELHQLLSDVSHQESLEEECHLLYCCGDIGSAISSPDSRWKLFLSETATRKSSRRSHRGFFARIIQCETPLSLLFFEFLFSEIVRWVLLSQLVHLYALFLRPASFELRFTIDFVIEESIVNAFVMFTLTVNFFATSFPRIESYMALFLFFNFAVSRTMTTLCLDHELRDRESIQS